MQVSPLIFNIEKFTEVEFEGIDHKDAPDYCDAYIVSAVYDGKEMTDEEIEDIDSDTKYELLMNYLY